MTEYGKPTAKKVSGCEFWMPAITSPFGPRALQHGERKESAYAAKKEAKILIDEAKNGEDKK